MNVTELDQLVNPSFFRTDITFTFINLADAVIQSYIHKEYNKRFIIKKQINTISVHNTKFQTLFRTFLSYFYNKTQRFKTL